MKKTKITAPVKASTQSFVEIEAIRDDILMLKDYSCCIIIGCGGVNFTLLSEEEQQAMIFSFAQLLNSLSFPVQISILSRRMDVSSYLDYLDLKIKKQADEILNKKLVAYSEFIRSIVKKNIILEKTFYFVIPFNPLEMGISGAKKKINHEYIFTRAKAALYPKKDHLLRLLKRSGLGGQSMFEQELVELFYALFNPLSLGKKLGPVKNYTDIVLTNNN